MSLTVAQNKQRLLKKMGLNKPKPKEQDEACWQGYKEVGMKKKGNKMVPNCVPEGKAKSRAQQAAIAISKKERGIDELSLSVKDIRKSGLRKTTDTDKLKKELEDLKKLLKQKNIKVRESFMSRRPGNQMSDLYKLYRLAIKAMPGSPKQKELKKRIAALRKELKLDEDVPANSTADIPDPKDTVQGPRKKKDKNKPQLVVDRRYTKKVGQPVLLKRFRDYNTDKGIS